MNNNQNIEIEVIFNIRDSALQTSLLTIESLTSGVADAFNRLGSVATSFNSINTALGKLSNASDSASNSGDGAATAFSAMASQQERVTNITNGAVTITERHTAVMGQAATATNIQNAAQQKLAVTKAKATLGQKALNLAMKANPILAIIGLVTTLVSVGGRLVSWFRDASAGATENGRSIRDLADEYGRSTDDIRSDMEQMGTTCLDTWESMEQSVRDFADAFGKDVDEVREHLHELGTDYEGMNAHLQSWENQENAVRAFAEQMGLSVDKVRTQMDELGIRYEQLNGNMEAMQSIGEQFGMSMTEVSDALERQGISMDQVLQMTPELAEGMMDAALQIDQLVEAYDAAYEAALASIQGQIGLFGELNMETEKTTESMIDTWNQQADAADKHADNLEAALAFGLAPELVDAFNDIEHAAELNALIEEMKAAGAAFEDGEATMSPAAQAIADNMEESFSRSQEAQNQLAHTMAEIETDFTNSVDNIIETIEGLDLASETTQHGAEALNGLIEGIQSREGAAGEAMNGAGKGALNALQAAIPDSATSGVGSNSMSSLAQGILSRKNEVLSAVRSITSEMSSLMANAMSSVSSRQISANIATAAQGFTQNLALATPGSDARYQSSFINEIRGVHDSIKDMHDSIKAGQHIVMDTGELVGATYHNYDCTAGSTI